MGRPTNRSGETINPATSEKQDVIITSLSSLSGSAGGYKSGVVPAPVESLGTWQQITLPENTVFVHVQSDENTHYVIDETDLEAYAGQDPPAYTGGIGHEIWCVGQRYLHFKLI